MGSLYLLSGRVHCHFVYRADVALVGVTNIKYKNRSAKNKLVAKVTVKENVIRKIYCWGDDLYVELKSSWQIYSSGNLKNR